MRKLLLLSLLCMGFTQIFSQQNQVKVGEYSLPGDQSTDKSVVIEMPYAKYEVLHISGDTTALHSAGDIMIDIICTDYPATASLEKLNNDRLNEVFRIFPFIKQENIRKVNYLRQLNGTEKDKAVTMFHGAVIWFRPVQTKETMEKDLEKLEAMLIPDSPKASFGDSAVSTDVPEKTVGTKTKKSLESVVKPFYIITEEPRRIAASGSGVPGVIMRKGGRSLTITWPLKSSRKVKIDVSGNRKVWVGTSAEVKDKIKKRDKIFFPNADSLSIMPTGEARKRGYIPTADSNFFKVPFVTVYFGPELHYDIHESHIDPLSLDSLALVKDSTSLSGYALNPKFTLPDSTVFRILQRNQWKNVIVVGDVTGSMYPYTAQLLLWLKLHSLDDFTTQFAFFNDGDNKSDDQKVIGRTGGIYFKRCHSFDEAKELVKSTMLKGCGGDAPENNIEALLLTEKEFPKNEFQVMIADNWAPIKDKSLINKLTKPVRVVLCGANEYGINIDYLNLARKTGGSVHLIEQDIFDLAAMHEGETLKIGSLTFKIVDGEFKQVNDFDKIKNL